MSDYLHAKTENVQKLLDNCLKKQKQELISEFLVKMKDIYFSLGDDKVENLMFAELKQEYEGRLKNWAKQEEVNNISVGNVGRKFLIPEYYIELVYVLIVIRKWR